MADEREEYGTIGIGKAGRDENARNDSGTGDASSSVAGEPAGIDGGAGSFERTDVRASATVRGEQPRSSGRGRIADQLQRVGDSIDERARHLEEAGGVQRRAGRVVSRASDALDSSADYIRSHEVNEMRDDLESAIRERPLLSVGIAVGAGFLLARLMRE